MAREDLYQLSAVLRVQLPVLFSFAVLRWVLGLLLGGVGARTMRACGLGHRVPLVVRVLLQIRAGLVMGMLLVVAVMWLEERLMGAAFTDMCVVYESVRVQGTCCALALTVMLTHGGALQLGMALATLKAVADLSSASVALACATAVFGMTSMISARAAFVVLGGMLGFSVSCHRKTGARVIGGPVLAVVFLLLEGAAIVLQYLCRSAWRAVCRGVNSALRGVLKRRAE